MAPASPRFGLADIGGRVVRTSGGHLLWFSPVESDLIRSLLAAEDLCLPFANWVADPVTASERLAVLPGLLVKGVVVVDKRKAPCLRLRLPPDKSRLRYSKSGSVAPLPQDIDHAPATSNDAGETTLDQLRAIQADVLGAVMSARGGRWLVWQEAVAPAASRQEHAAEGTTLLPGDSSTGPAPGESSPDHSDRPFHTYSTSWRSEPAEPIAAALERLVDVDAGIIAAIRRGSGLPEDIPVWWAGPNRALSTAHASGLTWRTPGHALGKGLTDSEARLSALAEAAERWSGTWGPGDAAAAWQSGYELRRSGEAVEPFDSDATIPQPWLGGTDLLTGVDVQVPAEMVLMGHPPVRAEARRTDSNGLAAGATLTDATVQGLLEIVEREAIHNWWTNAAPSTRIATPDRPTLGPFLEWLEWLGVSVDVRGLSSLPGTTTFMAIGWLPHTGRMLYGAGTHVDPEITLHRAVLELVQSTSAALATPSQLHPHRGVDPNPCGDAIRTGVPGKAWEELFPDTSAPARTRFAGDPISGAIKGVAGALAEQGRRTVSIDVTRPEVAIPVVRILVSDQRGMPQTLR